MALGRQGDRQGDLVVTWREMPRSAGHVLYERQQQVPVGTGFDAFAETTCKPFCAATMGAASIPPGRSFRRHMVGCFDGICSERGIEWRCAVPLSLRDCLRLETTARVPDRSRLSRARSCLPAEVHREGFGRALKRIAKHCLVKGGRIGVDASTMEAHAALRTIVRRETGETCRQMLKRIAEQSGIETPSAADLIRLDRARKGKNLSDADRASTTDADAKSAKMKDGATPLACKPEHAVDLDTGAMVAAEIHPADEGDTTTLKGTLEAAETNLRVVGRAPSRTKTAERVADKGYHSRAILKDLDGRAWKTRIPSPQRKAFLRWHGDEVAGVTGQNLGLLMRDWLGAGTPKEAAARGRVLLLFIDTKDILVAVLLALAARRGEDDRDFPVLAVTATRNDRAATSSTGCQPGFANCVNGDTGAILSLRCPLRCSMNWPRMLFSKTCPDLLCRPAPCAMSYVKQPSFSNRRRTTSKR
jgi:hypothetical protein